MNIIIQIYMDIWIHIFKMHLAHSAANDAETLTIFNKCSLIKLLYELME